MPNIEPAPAEITVTQRRACFVAWIRFVGTSTIKRGFRRIKDIGVRPGVDSTAIAPGQRMVCHVGISDIVGRQGPKAVMMEAILHLRLARIW